MTRCEISTRTYALGRVCEPLQNRPRLKCRACSLLSVTGVTCAYSYSDQNAYRLLGWQQSKNETTGLVARQILIVCCGLVGCDHLEEFVTSVDDHSTHFQPPENQKWQI